MKKFIIILTIFIFIFLGWLAVNLISLPDTESPIVHIPYIATLNGVPVPLSHYKIYLRDEVRRFEETGGSQIWLASFDGIPTGEVAKNHALESLIFVMLTNTQNYRALNEAELERARDLAEELFDSFTIDEQNAIGLDTVIEVMEAIILQQRIQFDLTQNYHPNDREAVFLDMYQVWRENAVVERNIDIWDSITIGE